LKFIKRRAECSPFLFSILLLLPGFISDLTKRMFAQISILFKENSKVSLGSLASTFVLIFTFLINTKGILDLALNNSKTFIYIIVLAVFLFIVILSAFFIFNKFASKKQTLNSVIPPSEEKAIGTISVEKKKKRLFIALLISSCIMVLLGIFFIVGIRQMRYAEMHYIALSGEMSPEECTKFKEDITIANETNFVGLEANQVKIIERTPEIHQCILKPAYFLESSCADKYNELSSYTALNKIPGIDVHIAPASSVTSIPNRIDYFSGGNETLRRILTKLNAIYAKFEKLIL
jgi:hypothetical protein